MEIPTLRPIILPQIMPYFKIPTDIIAFKTQEFPVMQSTTGELYNVSIFYPPPLPEPRVAWQRQASLTKHAILEL